MVKIKQINNKIFDKMENRNIEEKEILEAESSPKIRSTKTKTIVLFAIFLSFVILFQTFGSYIKIGMTSISLVLIPIVLGGILLGPVAGMLLGFAFGLITLISGVVGIDGFTAILFAKQPISTSILCLIKGALAGYASAFLYKSISKKSLTAAVFTASAAAPIVNTGIFIIGALFMSDTISSNFVPSGMSVIYFLVIFCAGVNFLVELALNIVVTPSLILLIKTYKKRKY